MLWLNHPWYHVSDHQWCLYTGVRNTHVWCTKSQKKSGEVPRAQNAWLYDTHMQLSVVACPMQLKLLISYCYSSCFSTELCITFSAFYQSLMYSLCYIWSDLLCVESDVKFSSLIECSFLWLALSCSLLCVLWFLFFNKKYSEIGYDGIPCVKK